MKAVRLEVDKNPSFSDTTWDAMLAKVKLSLYQPALRKPVTRYSEVTVTMMNPGRFLQLHEWLDLSEINAADHCTDAATCQAAILAKREDYYRPIIINTKGTAFILHDKLKVILQNQGNTEFAKYIKQIVGYDEENK